MGVVSDRMRGLIRSGIISPLTSTMVSASLEYVLDKTGLEQALIQHLESDYQGPEGVAAGGAEEPSIGDRLQEWKDEKKLVKE